MPLLIFLYHDSVVLRGFEPTGKGCGDSAEAWNSVWMQQMLQDLGPMTRFLSAIPAVLLGLAEAWNLERMFLQAFSVAVHLSNPLLSMPFHVAAMKKLIEKKNIQWTWPAFLNTFLQIISLQEIYGNTVEINDE